MLDKSGNLCYRSHTSKCQKCTYFLKNAYECWMHRMIPFRVWENCIGYECDKFKSILKDQLNSHYIFPDFEDRDRFPEKRFGGRFKFDKCGKIIGEL